ncbi:aspartyl protease [Ceratobasidium sp. AG-Ba]|nr:aspartyl protease [Ceratobasidium sp. AG-Ba]
MVTRLILTLVPLAVVNAQEFHGGYWKRTSGGGGPETFVIPLAQDPTGFYHSSVRMGSDDQKFNFSISGSTGYTIVAGQVCNACGDQNPLYTGKNSTSFQPLGSVLDVAVDGVNQVFGNLAKENCGLKQTNGSWWQYNNQTILIANSVNDGTRDVFNVNISGIFGLSPTAESGSPTDTVLGAWLSRHPQAQNVSVGFALKRPDILNTTASSNNSTVSTNSSSPAGEMHMLAPDPDSYYGQLSYVPTVSYESTGGSTSGTGGGQQMQATGWSTKLEEWTFLNGNGDRAVGGQGAVAAVDPWYAAIIMPRSQSENIFAKIAGSQLVSPPEASQQIWNIPCNTRMNLTISIGGIDFDMDPRDMIIQGDTVAGNTQKRQDAMCECAVQGWTDPEVPGYMLGSSFMRNAYVVYNTAQSNSSQENSIGFGRRFPFNPPSAAQSQQARTTGIIIGSVVGVVALIGLAALGWLWVRTTRRNAHRAPSDEFTPRSPSVFVHGGYSIDGGRNTGAKIGGLSITPGVIFTAFSGNDRRGSDPEVYPLMLTPPTTGSPPREGKAIKSFSNQQQQPPLASYNDEPPQELHNAAHEAYLARIARRTQIKWSSETRDTAGYAKISDQDGDAGAHAYGDHAPVYGEQGRYDPDRSPPRSAGWDQPYFPPAPPSGNRMSMVVEPITKPAEAALPRDDTRS